MQIARPATTAPTELTDHVAAVSAAARAPLPPSLSPLDADN